MWPNEKSGARNERVNGQVGSSLGNTSIVAQEKRSADTHPRRRASDVPGKEMVPAEADPTSTTVGSLPTPSTHDDAVAERELAAVSKLGGADRLPVTEKYQGIRPISVANPLKYSIFLARYQMLVERSVEERIYKVKHDISDELQDFAAELGKLRANARDVIEIHTHSMRLLLVGVSGQKASLLLEEGRLRVLELMGDLTNHYRCYTTGFQKNRGEA